MAALLCDPPSSWAVADIPTVITNLRNWVVGILAGLATLFLTFGGLRYLMAGGDPGEVEAAKRALKAAAIGYGLAVLAPVLVTVLQGIVGEGGGAE
ncbi:pilin [Streptomyces monticola]|uniref:Pilin n=1 Tax=Streptomyces monticola TaxID=2666263 RepID=A0ABW2JH99_9ACTN